MKKCRTMRLASAMLVLTLLSTCMISGTFAKYVTSDTATDTARVAKWGVTVTAEGSLFGKYYEPKTGTNPNEISLTAQGSVDTSAADNIVAPGTQNTTGMTFTITGKPEVKVAVEVNATLSNEISLEQGNYDDLTTGDNTDTFSNATKYYPVKYTLVQTTVGGSAITLVNGGTLKDVVDALNASDDVFTHVMGKDIGETFGVYKLTWEWPYVNTTEDADSKRDTVLGNAAVSPISGANTTAGFNLTVSVTQVD